MFTLVLTLLTIESSYATETERPARSVPDTVQFWYAPDMRWRIKTFAIDHDIHVHSFGAPGDSFGIESAIKSTNKNYGDVIARTVVLEFSDPSDTSSVASILAQAGLTGSLELVDTDYAFYNPDRGDYSSQTEPS